MILFASVRRNGKSLAQIAGDEIGPVAGIAASLAILFIIIVALAGLGLAVVNALSQSPWGTFTIALTIPIALFMGIYLHRIRPGKVAEMSTVGVLLLFIAVFSGHYVPGSFLDPFFNLSKNSLLLSIAIYGFIASVLPVWLLLAPRDYLSTYMKIGTIFLLSVGVIIIAPNIQMPPVTLFAEGGGPIIPGKLFPFMFITIACGAISGLHSLISSGTTPKMLMNEKDIPFIGFGAMLVEGFVAVMALVIIAGEDMSRLDVRCKVDLPVSIMLDSNTRSVATETKFTSLSLGGGFIECAAPRVENKIVGLKYDLPKYGEFEILGEV